MRRLVPKLAVLGMAAALVAGLAACGDGGENRCDAVQIGGRTAANIVAEGIGCDAAAAIARDARNRPEPDYLSGDFHCVGKLGEASPGSGDATEDAAIAYICSRPGARVTFDLR